MRIMAKDPYPEHMRASINNVEKTREKRLSQTMDMCTADEIEDALKKYHPDHILDQKVERIFTNRKRVVLTLFATFPSHLFFFCNSPTLAVRHDE